VWSPLIPGTQLTLNGEADRGGGLLPHEVVTTVTDLTKVIDGVRAVVILEKDINEGVLQEAELRFEAQDNAGNIWNLGEYPEEYEDGKFSAAPDVWLAGLAKAEPGQLNGGGSAAGITGISPGLVARYRVSGLCKDLQDATADLRTGRLLRRRDDH
jgi:hypothetical protein